jgi:hypothetical protein
MATLLTATGERREILPAAGEGCSFTLAELQALVGGYIEALRAPGGHWLFINEDGKRLDLPVNRLASILLRHRLRPDDYIVGDAVLCSPEEAGEGS